MFCNRLNRSAELVRLDWMSCNALHVNYLAPRGTASWLIGTGLTTQSSGADPGDQLGHLCLVKEQ